MKPISLIEKVANTQISDKLNLGCFFGLGLESDLSVGLTRLTLADIG